MATGGARRYKTYMRAAALLAAALAAACGGANRAEREHLAQLRAICAGIPGKTYNEAGADFGTLAVGIDDRCVEGRSFGSCPQDATLCRVVWVWQPVDGRLCSPVGNCIYQCEAFAPGAPGPSTGDEVICGSASSGP